jgi:hypothetical protein
MQMVPSSQPRVEVEEEPVLLVVVVVVAAVAALILVRVHSVLRVVTVTLVVPAVTERLSLEVEAVVVVTLAFY